MTTSSVLHSGPKQLAVIEEELLAWMRAHEYVSVEQLRGSATHATADDPSAFERANYMRTLQSWSTPA